MNLPSIPQCDPRASYLEHAAEIDDVVNNVFHKGRYILGDEVAAFESEFAAYCGSSSGLGVASGTDALEIALRATGISSGDIVVTVSHTAVATVAAIRRCGAIPLLLDVTENDGLMDPDRLDAALEGASRGSLPFRLDQIKAIVPVHLYGRCADMPRIMDAAIRYGLAVVEDCAQAHGARIQDRIAGSWGVAGSFSFYPTKNLGAIGDGGAMISNDAEVAERGRLLREYGWKRRYISDIEGSNSRLDELQAAILRVKLRFLDRDNLRRREIAQQYTDAAAQAGIESPGFDERYQDVFHQYVIRVDGRDALQSWLREQGIGTLIHYPMPVHLQPAYAGHIHSDPAGMAITERLAGRILSLPMYPQLDDEQVLRVCSALHLWGSRSGRA